MDNKRWRQLEGFRRLLHDGVARGADFVEKHHRRTAGKPFAVLEAIPPLAPSTRFVRIVHDAVLSVAYGTIQVVNRTAGLADEWVFEQLAPSVDGKDTQDRDRPGQGKGVPGR